MGKINDVKREYVIDKATELFLNGNINEITMGDIAVFSGVGEATLYRYFTKKQNLVVYVATKLAQSVLDKLKSQLIGDGRTRLLIFYNIYLEVYLTHKNFYRFINAFDGYLVDAKEKDIADYECILDQFKAIFDNIYQDCLKEGSVKTIDDINMFYYATTHTLMSLCGKLACVEITKTDETICKTKEIETITNLILSSILK